MDEAKLFRRDSRATRDEPVRKQAQQKDSETAAGSRLLLIPDQNEEYLRLALMYIDTLETHIERLERDLEDLESDDNASDR